MTRLSVHPKTLIIAGLLVLLTLVCWLIEPRFLSRDTVGTTLKYAGLFGIITIGMSFVIVTGGIDLSIGSWIGFSAVLFPVLIRDYEYSALAATAIVVGLSAVAGGAHGLLVTGLKLQPFLVTLCGLFIYRGLARVVSEGKEQRIPAEQEWMQISLVQARPLPGLPVPSVFLILLIVTVVAGIFLNRTVTGRYMLAVGRNEQGARFSGVNTAGVRILAFVVCTVLAGLAGLLFLADSRQAMGSSTGSFFELWAIAGAVLGGCSLRGGECTMAGVLLGSLMVAEVRQGVLFVVRDDFKEIVLGLLVLGGVIADEYLTRWLARPRK